MSFFSRKKPIKRVGPKPVATGYIRYEVVTTFDDGMTYTISGAGRDSDQFREYLSAVAFGLNERGFKTESSLLVEQRVEMS